MKEPDLFDPKHEHIVRRNLSKMLESFDLPEAGKKSRPPDFSVEIRKEVIRSKLKQRFGLDNATLRYLIFSAIMQIKIKKIINPGLKEFADEFAAAVEAYEKRPQRKITFLCPLNALIDNSLEVRTLIVQGHEFRRTNWGEIHSLPGWKDFLKDVQSHRNLASALESQFAPMHQYFTPFLVNVHGRDIGEAFQSAYVNFELMRSVLNLFSGFGRWSIQFGNAVQLGSILAPLFFVAFMDEGKYIYSSFNEEPYTYREVKLTSHNIADLNRLLIKVDGMDSEIKLMFVDSLIKYVHALDTVDWPDAFLMLWQVLENLSLSSISARLKMDEVCSRIKNLMGMTDVLHKELIDAVVETRNTYVHLGKFSEDGLMEVQYLKILVEWALSNFYTLSERYPDKKSWEEHFSLISLNPSVLERKRKAIDSVIQLKQDAQEYIKKLKKP